MSKIKLIASDLDGTLLPEGTKDINPEIYTVVRQLKENGIIFVPASGRELPTMRTVLEPIKDDVYFIANNGGVISKGVDEAISVLSLDWEVVKAVVTDVKKDHDCAFVSFNTTGGTYTDSTNKDLLEWLKDGYGMNPIVVPDMLSEKREAIKISVFVNVDASLVAPDYIKKYGTRAHVTAAGANWIDFTHSQADKGIAFNRLIETLGIAKEETWAFGDNENDISMLQAAGCGFAAPEARAAVKKAADVCLKGDIWDSVIIKLKELL